MTGCQSNTGTVTITNPTLAGIKINFMGKDFELAPEKHFTQKGIKSGTYSLAINGKEQLTIPVNKGKTTIVDTGGDNCFVVADYTSQYGKDGSGSVKVIEKHFNQKYFVPEEKITAGLGEKLPQNQGNFKKVTRIHRVDCSWIDNDQAIIDAISNLP